LGWGRNEDDLHRMDVPQRERQDQIGKKIKGEQLIPGRGKGIQLPVGEVARGAERDVDGSIKGEGMIARRFPDLVAVDINIGSGRGGTDLEEALHAARALK